MKNSIKMYLWFVVFFELSLYILFKIIHTLAPSTLIFDQLFLISCLNVLVFLGLARLRVKNQFDKIVAIVFIGLFLMFLNQMFILNIDRSRSTYVLAWVDKGYVSNDSSAGLITNGILSKENLNEEATIQRIRENIDRGLISVSEESVRLTSAGRFLLLISQETADIFDLKGWKLNSK
jgi:hypothetical protein